MDADDAPPASMIAAPPHHGVRAVGPAVNEPAVVGPEAAGDPEPRPDAGAPGPVAEEDPESGLEAESGASHGEPALVSPLTPPALASKSQEARREGFDWDSAMRQSLFMLAVQHGYRMTEDKTRRFLPGPFFKDWFGSVKNLHGWDDGGSVFGNYIAHPMQGAITGYIYINNSPTAKRLEFENSKAYWKSRMKAMGWSALTSAQFELGPLGQAAIGNVGLGPNHKKMAFVDLVVTPTAGTGWLVLEDIIDKKILKKLEARTTNRTVVNLARMSFTPMRACANLLRFKMLWYRDDR
jgi:hypothetical protein